MSAADGSSSTAAAAAAATASFTRVHLRRRSRFLAFQLTEIDFLVLTAAVVVRRTWRTKIRKLGNEGGGGGEVLFQPHSWRLTGNRSANDAVDRNISKIQWKIQQNKKKKQSHHTSCHEKQLSRIIGIDKTNNTSRLSTAISHSAEWKVLNVWNGRVTSQHQPITVQRNAR